MLGRCVCENNGKCIRLLCVYVCLLCTACVSNLFVYYCGVFVVVVVVRLGSIHQALLFVMTYKFAKPMT